MSLENIVNLIVAIVILLMAAGVFAGFSLVKMAETIDRAIDELYFQTTRKADLIPLYVELMSKYFDKSGFGDLIELRSKYLQEKSFGSNKKALEEALWSSFDGVLASAMTDQRVKADLQLKALDKDMVAAKLDVEKYANVYNKLVKKYLKFTQFFLLKPLTLLLKLKRFEVY